MDEYRLSYIENWKEGWKAGWRIGLEEAMKEHIAALKGILEPTVIAERFKVPLAQVMEIWDC